MISRILVPSDFVLPLRSRPLHHQTEPFLKGPIPMAWLDTAAKLPGKALAIGIALWFRVGLKRSQTIALNLSRLGLDRTSAARGLTALERAELIHVARGRGKKAIVTVLVPTIVKRMETPRE